MTLLLLIFSLTSQAGLDFSKTLGPDPVLPAPYSSTIAADSPTVVGWPAGMKPQAPDGFKVELFADHLPNPRKLYRLPNGDVLVAEATNSPKSANRIELFRGKEKFTFLTGLNQPFGMLLIKGWFYVGNTNSVVRYPYRDGQTQITAKGEKILDLPSLKYRGHWTRNLVSSPDENKIYVSVGSSSNVAESGIAQENRRADILEINPDGTGEKIFASGIRNPVGLAFHPETHALWTVVNERDNLGDDLVPDYLTHVERDAFYGWPYSYYGQHEDPRRKERPDLVKNAIAPDFALGNHVAPLGLAFYDGKTFPEKYQSGAFIGEHGSWNSSVIRGYQVYFVPFTSGKNGKPTGLGEPFLTGFVKDAEKHIVYGRPVDVITLSDGSLLVTDDVGGKIWRVSFGN